MPEINEQSYKALKREVDDARSAAQQARGALLQMEKQLTTDFECDTIEEAEAKLKRLEAEKETARKAFEKKFADYEKKWKA